MAVPAANAPTIREIGSITPAPSTVRLSHPDYRICCYQRNTTLEYGRLAIIIYVIIQALVLTGFALAITFGFKPQSAAGGVGTFGAAWVATKLTQPLRILATLLCTPVIARLLNRAPKR